MAAHPVDAESGRISARHDHYSLTCAKCGHTGSMHRWSDDRDAWEAAATGFDGLRVSSGGLVFGRCLQCRTVDVIENEWLLRSG